ncbi:MAG: hypothetical protein EXS58_13590 [Candidatus Latescibacteria bacterium]|nr:hypothetical protein [Candidatus Latescibacterota bacterium]
MIRHIWYVLVLATASLAAAAEPGLKPSYSASMGSVTVGDQQLYRLSLRPDIPIGNWGLALDVELFIDNKGGISKRGWDLGTSTKATDTFLRKLYYVRYGKEQDQTFVQVGALDQVTLGYGLIMGGYRNTLQYPGIKKTGLYFHKRDIGGMGLGVEGMVNNFQDFQQGSALLGARVSGKATGKLELGLTYVVDLDQYGGLVDGDGDGYPDAVDAFPGDKSRALDNDGDGVADSRDSDDNNNGAIDADPSSGLPPAIITDLTNLNTAYSDTVFPVDQLVSRKRPFNKDQVGGDFFSILGFDAAYPLMQSSQLSLKLYGQAALLIDTNDSLTTGEADSQGVQRGNRKAKGFGLAAPGLWLGMGPFKGQLEFRHFQKDFDSNYFDNLYELDRARLVVATGKAQSKDASLNRNQTLSGIFGKAGTDLGGMVDASADYQYLTGADDPKQQIHASASLSQHLLDQIPRLRQAQAYYQKNNIGMYRDEKGKKDGFLDPTPATFYGYLLGLDVNSGVALQWDTRVFYHHTAVVGKLERQKVMTIETVFTF